MHSSKYLWLLFALLASHALCDDPMWNNSAFSVPPIVLKTMEVQKYAPSLKLLTGPGAQKNLLGLEYILGEYRIIDLMILNTSDLSIIRDYMEFDTVFSLKKTELVSTPDFIFYASVSKDQQNMSQIVSYILRDNDYRPDPFQLTNSTDKKTHFKILQLIAYSKNPIVIYMTIREDNKTLYVALIKTSTKEVEKTIEIATGADIKNVTCDSDLDKNKSVLCLYKIDATVYRAYIPLQGSSSPTIDSLYTDIPQGMEQVMYIPQKVVGAKDGFAYFMVAQKPDGSMLRGHTADVSTFLGVTYSKGVELGSFSALDAHPLRGALLYGDGFATFQRDVKIAKQTWSYTIYNQDLSVNQTEIKFAELSGGEPEFMVAKEYGSGAINIAAYNYSSLMGKTVMNIFYGQLLSKSPLEQE